VKRPAERLPNTPLEMYLQTPEQEIQRRNELLDCFCQGILPDVILLYKIYIILFIFLYCINFSSFSPTSSCPIAIAFLRFNQITSRHRSNHSKVLKISTI